MKGFKVTSCQSWRSQICLFHISVRNISAEGHFGQNFSVTEHFGHGTFRSQNISVTEHFGHRTFRSQNILVTELFGHRTFRSGYISVRDFFGQRTIQYTFALFFIIILSHLLGSNKNVKNWQNALKPI